MPRKPEGDRALTGAERMRRYRAQHPEIPVLRYRRPKDRRSRAQRWRDAVAELQVLQEDYFGWLESLPPSLEQSATAEALRAIIDYDLGELAALEPPRGYGRD
jgi:hypothetical protein